jgi:aspartate ammonia-lyase
VPVIGYERVEGIVRKAESDHKTVAQAVEDEGLLTRDQVTEILAPKRLYKLGFDRHEYDDFGRD